MTKQNKIVVITGPGRSGTSLCMNALLTAGMSGSPEYIDASEQNPKGFFEDKKIIDIHQRLVTDLFFRSIAPRPGDWMTRPKTRQEVRTLSDLVEARIEGAKTIWGFKDPRTALLIPIWIRIFNKYKLNPIYVFCHRHPRSVVQSLIRQCGPVTL